MSKPNTFNWATNTNFATGPYAGQVNKQTPPAGIIQDGLIPGYVAAAEYLNERLNLIGQWLQYFDAFPTIAGAAFINGGTALSHGYGLDGTTPFTHSGTGSFSIKLSATIADVTKVLVFVAPLTISGFGNGVTVDGLNVACSTKNSSATAVDTTCVVLVLQLP